MQIHFKTLLGLLSIALLTACGSDPFKSSQSTPSAFGDINQLVVVQDPGFLETPVFDSLDYYFAGPYLILPQPEPLFDLKYFETPQVLRDGIVRQYRSYVIPAVLSDADSPTTQLVREYLGAEKLRTLAEAGGAKTFVNRNRWAAGQVIYFMVGETENQLLDLFRSDAPGVIDQLKRDQIERHRATAFAVQGENMNTRTLLAVDMGVDLTMPASFQMVVRDTAKNFAWLRQDIKEQPSANIGPYVNSIIVRKIPYESQEQLTADYAKRLINETGREYVQSTVENSFKQIDDQNLPLLVQPTTINNNFALQLRGIWEMENDAMAGPFVAYLIHNPADGELLLAEAFIFAPNEEKRDYMEQLDMLLRGIRFV